MASVSFSEEQHTPFSTLTSTKLKKLTTVFRILYYVQILSYWVQFKLRLFCLLVAKVLLKNQWTKYILKSLPLLDHVSDFSHFDSSSKL